MNTREAAVETVLALMRARQAPAGPVPAWVDDAPWEEVIEVASAGLVLPALAEGARASPGGLDNLGDAGRFLAAMEASNAARNERLMLRLREAAAALGQADIAAVALKGSVFCLEEPDHAPWRFLGDLDLLIPAKRMEDAVRALQRLSYEAQDGSELGEELHHHAPLVHADGETIVELHTRLFPREGNELLPAHEILAAAQETASAPQAWVPPARQRLVHLIAHAQLANGRFRRRTVSLRDALDFAVLMQRGDIDPDEIVQHFRAHGHVEAATGFLVAMNRLLGDPFPLPRSADSGAPWADSAIASLLAPAQVRRRIAWEWLRDQAALLGRKEGRRRAWAGIRDPLRRRRFLQRKLFGWRNVR